MSVPTIPLYSGVIPNRATQSPEAFTNAAITWTDYQAVTFIPAVNAQTAAVNGVVIGINQDKQAAEQAASEAAASQLAASNSQSVASAAATQASNALNQIIAYPSESALAAALAPSNSTVLVGGKQAQNLLEVGSFGLGARIDISNPDLDTLPTGSFLYYVRNSINLPVTENGWLRHEGLESDSMFQIFESLFTDKVLFRRKLQGSWAPWQEFIHTGNRYQPINSSITLEANRDYHVMGAQTLELPTGSPSGSKIKLTKEIGATVTINRGGSELIKWTGGTDTQVIFNINAEIVFTRNSAEQWEI